MSKIRFMRASDIEPFRSTATQWGRWRYHASNLTLRDIRGHYEVDLETCTTSAEVLDWIVQISKKTWASPEDVADLIYALDDLLNLQANLCPFGQEEHITRQEVARIIGRDGRPS